MNVCVVCDKNNNNYREFTCSEKCHKIFVEKLIKLFGKYKKVIDINTMIAYKVPTIDIIEKGLRHSDLPKYPLWK
jgi:predicted nucleic acid-binding Zn ribbon protein